MGFGGGGGRDVTEGGPVGGRISLIWDLRCALSLCSVGHAPQKWQFWRGCVVIMRVKVVKLKWLKESFLA